MEMNHILVVEDDKEIREGVKIYLQSQGYEVFLAADGIEGLEVMEKEDIHLRMTLGEETTREDLDYTVDTLKEIVANLRSMSPLYEDFIKKQNA